jgi:hypothetical protein
VAQVVAVMVVQHLLATTARQAQRTQVAAVVQETTMV